MKEDEVVSLRGTKGALGPQTDNKQNNNTRFSWRIPYRKQILLVPLPLSCLREIHNGHLFYFLFFNIFLLRYD